jgi:hypothetical protein
MEAREAGQLNTYIYFVRPSKWYILKSLTASE